MATFSCSARMAWSRSAWASGPAAAAWAEAASVSALISACFRFSARFEIAICSSARIRACSASCRELASATDAVCSSRAASGRPRSAR